MSAITIPFPPPPAKITIETGGYVWTLVATWETGERYALDSYAPEAEVAEAVQQPALFDLVEADCE